MAAEPKPIELYYWPTPNGWKITIMLEELGVPYEVKSVNIGQGEQFEPEFLEISPNNRMPAIVDPDGPGGKPISIFESGAILQYLGRKYRQVLSRPTSAAASRSSSGCSGRWAGSARWPARRIISATMRPRRSPTPSTATPTKCNRLYGVMNKRLGRPRVPGRRLFDRRHGASVGWTRSYKNQGQDLDEFPNLKRWFETIMARPAVIAGIEVGRAERERAASLADDKEAQKVLFGQRARQ